MTKPKPSVAQEDILIILLYGGKITGDWVTSQFWLWDRFGYRVSSILKRTMEVLTRNNWVAWNKDKGRTGDTGFEYLITEEGRRAVE